MNPRPMMTRKSPTSRWRGGSITSRLSTPSKEHRSPVRSSDARPVSSLPKPAGVLALCGAALLLLALVVAVIVRLARIEACADDPDFALVVKVEKSCATYVAHLGDGPHREGRCNRPIGIPDENGFRKSLKHYCRKSCGLCDRVDPASRASKVKTRGDAGANAEEIVSDEILWSQQMKEAMEDQEIDEMIEMGLGEIDKELRKDGGDEGIAHSGKDT